MGLCFGSASVSPDLDSNFDQTERNMKIMKETKQSKKLVVLCGDASDADGTIELAQIAKTGVDVLYLMHVSKPFSCYGSKAFEDILSESKEPNLSFPERCKNFNAKASRNAISYEYGTNSDAKTLIQRCQFAFQEIFDQSKPTNSLSQFFFRYESDSKTGSYYYNTHNPFGYIWKSELEIYNDSFGNNPLKSSSPIPALENYSEVILDISGSTSFWDKDHAMVEYLRKAKVAGKLKYVFVMGSVEIIEPPKTLKSDAMIRHPMATMNQLFSPNSFCEIMSELSGNDMKWVVVTNNVVNRIANYEKEFTSKKDFFSFITEKVLQSTNQESLPMLMKVLDSFYSEKETFKWKLFDCLIGKLISDYLIKSSTPDGGGEMILKSEPMNGISLTGQAESFDNFFDGNPDLKNMKWQTVYGVIVPSFITEGKKFWYEEEDKNRSLRS